MSELSGNCPESIGGKPQGEPHGSESEVSAHRRVGSARTTEYTCPVCGVKKYYGHKRRSENAREKNLACKDCRMRINAARVFERNCPACDRVLPYKSLSSRNLAEKRNSICHPCAMNEVSGRDYIRRERSERMKGRFAGEKNPFFGKTHTPETLLKIQLHTDHSYTRTDEFRAKMSMATKGDKNPMFGRNYYEVWVSKYGKDEADKRMADYRKKMSVSTRGSKNGMFGKPAPARSGNGWSGWYCGHYFRSLRELSFIVLVLEPLGCKWVSGECDKLRVKYIDEKGRERTHIADFLVDDKYLVEVKPRNLMHVLFNILKRQAMNDFCCDHDYEYRIFDVDIIPFEKLKELYENGSVKFTEKWDARMKKMMSAVSRVGYRVYQPKAKAHDSDI